MTCKLHRRAACPACLCCLSSLLCSNGGVFGSVLSTPIINPPQSAILGMHATNMRPWVVNGQIVPR
jgi:pyruvate/2-oxoglutarate dehydrogenase complex dihydrolipoamide acyltransferase (E2) component